VKLKFVYLFAFFCFLTPAEFREVNSGRVSRGHRVVQPPIADGLVGGGVLSVGSRLQHEHVAKLIHLLAPRRRQVQGLERLLLRAEEDHPSGGNFTNLLYLPKKLERFTHLIDWHC